jgi:hypothetical protein
MDKRMPGIAPISFDSIEFSRRFLSLVCAYSPDVRCPCLHWFPDTGHGAAVKSAAPVCTAWVSTGGHLGDWRPFAANNGIEIPPGIWKAPQASKQSNMSKSRDVFLCTFARELGTGCDALADDGQNFLSFFAA